MKSLSSQIKYYASQISGRADVYEKRQEYIQYLEENIKRELANPERNQVVLDSFLEEYNTVKMRPVAWVIQTHGEVNEDLVDKYESVIDLLRYTDDVDRVEYKFKKMKRERIKEKYKQL